MELLKAIADQTGGTVAPTVEQLFARNGDESRHSLPLWPWLALAGLLAYLADVFLRRAPWAWRRFGS